MTAGKMVSLLVLGATMFMVMPVWASKPIFESKIDISELTCKELMRGNNNDREIGLAFYHGFLAGKKNDHTVDLHAAFLLTDRVKDYCISNPTATIMEAFTKSLK
ncbi:HdeA/HdeB family chaperone [Desulfopila sp. IMCC35008]|uniref:HdeA/HdeB family chaperone n=1 Tax=Desulfopila sp. IMCC35008 TaxID=2653858 RepID=UPI0013D6473E|nr:HdeA/HdeB family chaperone [Desulfopila sp. IMCC35008]